VTVNEIVAHILRLMNSELKPDVRNEISNEILHQYLSAEKARHLLNWKPLFNLTEGLTHTIEWYKNFLGVKA
jgi:CDP-glucose 4,6-dehydratase